MKDDDLNISEYAGKLIHMVDTEGEMERLLRIRQWFLNTQFYRDFHYGTFNAQGVYQTLSDDEMEDLRYTSDFFFSIETQATQWTQSSPELSIDPGNDTNQAKATKRHVEKELEPYREKHWNDIFKQSMAKFAMLSTIYFINTRPKVSDAQIKVPKFDQKQISSKPTVYGEGDETATLPGYTAEAAVPNGTHSLPEIECEVELVDPTEIKIDPKCRAGKICMADWMRRERYLRDYDAEALHPGWEKLPTSNNSSPQRSDALEYKRSLEMSMGGQTMTSQENDSGRVLQRQYWFDPKVYKHRGPEKEDCEYGGVKFKKGDVLIKKYPNGWYIEQFNGKAVALFDEDKNKRWVGGVDTVDPSSPYGRGRTGLRNLQEMKDEGVSLGFSYLMRAVLGTSLYDPMMVEASDYADNRVGGALPLKPGAQIDGRTIEKAVYNVPYQAINGGFIGEFLTIIDDAMPKAGGGTYDILGGGQGEGAGAKTLGGQTQQLQTSAGMVGPALQLRTEAEIECFYQYLEQVQQYASDAHFQRIAGAWGDADARAFRDCKDEDGKSLIREMVKITGVPNSEIPRTQMDRRNDVGLAIQSGIANPQLPMIPGVRKYGLEQLRIPIEDDPDEQSKLVGEALLEKMKQAAKYAQGMAKQMGIQPDPQQVAPAISGVATLVKQRDDGSLPVFKAVFQEFLRAAVDAEDGIEADPALQLAVQMKIDEIEMFDVQLAGDLSAKQALAQAPGAMAEKALNDEGQEDPEAAAQAEQGTAQAQAEIQSGQNQDQALMAAHQSELDSQGKAADHAENERQRQHDAREGAAQRAHELQIAKRQASQKSQPSR